MLKGNKGEWSETYAIIKILADGNLQVADENLEPLQDVLYTVLSILRSKSNQNWKYTRNGNIKLFDATLNEEIATFSIDEFVEKSKQLFDKIKISRGPSFTIPEFEQFLRSIKIENVKSSKSEKSDINIHVHDSTTGLEPLLRFSIKSKVGGKATLFNAGKTTNFIYSVDRIKLSKKEINKVNKISEEPMIKHRIEKLLTEGASINYYELSSPVFKLNLQLIDSDLPQILANLVYIRYSENVSKLLDLLPKLEALNPMNYDLSLGHPFYKYKIKNFLTDVALGMTPSTLWDGRYDATGGIIIVKEDGDLICYHLYNRNHFQEYLFNNTRLEQASTSEFDFGKVYTWNGRNLINLNLQIRFS